VVQNLVKIITGGVDPSNPGVATGSIGQQPGKLKVDDINGSGCTFTEDTTYSYTIQLNDTTTDSSKGHYSLSSTCQSGSTLGTFTEIGNFTIGQTTPSLSATYNESADITVSLVAATSSSTSTSNEIWNGTESVDGTYNYTNGKSGTQDYSFNFHAITVDGTGIYTGSTDYTAKVSGVFGSWNYSGTLTYLSHTQVKITLGGNTYLVNLTTQQVDIETP
jgi:hypothetical protein